MHLNLIDIDPNDEQSIRDGVHRALKIGILIGLLFWFVMLGIAVLIVEICKL